MQRHWGTPPVPDAPTVTSATSTPDLAAPSGAGGVVGGSTAAGQAHILRRQSRKWWRLEQKAARRRDYLAAHEYATLADKYWDKAEAAEQGNGRDEGRA